MIRITALSTSALIAQSLIVLALIAGPASAQQRGGVQISGNATVIGLANNAVNAATGFLAPRSGRPPRGTGSSHLILVEEVSQLAQALQIADGDRPRRDRDQTIALPLVKMLVRAFPRNADQRSKLLLRQLDVNP